MICFQLSKKILYSAKKGHNGAYSNQSRYEPPENNLENNNILYELQHGFRHNRSCETQLLSFIQELSEAHNKNIQTDLIIMDFA